MRILVDILPASVRKYVYALWALVGLVIGSTMVGFGALAGVELPSWLIVASAVYAFATPALGLTAYANTNPEQIEPSA